MQRIMKNKVKQLKQLLNKNFGVKYLHKSRESVKQ